MIIQFCGLSGSGKTTIAAGVKILLRNVGIPVEIIDGDVYRKVLCADLGFSKDDRNENIRRLAFIAGRFSAYGIVPIICAINPYEEVREEVRRTYPDVRTVFIECGLPELHRRDTKGLYARALLPAEDPGYVSNLSGVNDPFELPVRPDLILQTDLESADESTGKLFQFIVAHYKTTT